MFFKHLFFSIPQILLTIFTGEEISITMAQTPEKMAHNFTEPDGTIDQEALADFFRNHYDK
jgi:hypothetical protein